MLENNPQYLIKREANIFRALLTKTFSPIWLRTFHPSALCFTADTKKNQLRCVHEPIASTLGESFSTSMGEGDQKDGGEVVIMRSGAGHSLCYLKMDGVLYPPMPGYSSHLKRVQDFPCRKDDVWIFGYPKSGQLVCVCVCV